MRARHATPLLTLLALLAAASACRGCGSCQPAPPPGPPPATGEAPPPAPPRPTSPEATPTAPAPPEAAPPAPAQPAAPKAAQPSGSPPAPRPPPGPGAPTGLTTAAAGQGRVRLRWQAPGGAASYELLRDGQVVARPQEAEAEVAGVRTAVRTCFAAVALDAEGRRSAPSPVACLTIPDTTPPSAPAVTATVEGKGLVRLGWAAATDDVGVTAYEVRRGGALLQAVRGLAFEEAGLPAARPHCYAVVALDAAGNRSPPSAEACVTVPDTTPPSTPAGLTATPKGETQIVLGWRPSSDDVGVTGYELLREGVVAATPAATAATYGGLTAATRACFTVVALDAAGNRSAPSEPACATTLDLTPPTVPPAVQARPLSDTRMELTWQTARDNVGVTGYAVARDGTELAEVPGLALRDDGLRPARRYCYTVRARDAAGNRSPASPPACATTPDLTPPTAPGQPAAAALDERSVEVQWGPSTDDVGVTAYELYADGVKVADATESPATARGFKPASQVCLEVKARDAAGNRSAASGQVCATTSQAGSPTAPRRLRAAEFSGDRVNLAWEPSGTPDVVYRVAWDNGRRVGTTKGTSFLIVGMLPGERRCFKVSAEDPKGKASPQTFETCVSLPAR